MPDGRPTAPELKAIHLVSNEKFYGHFEQWYLNKEVKKAFGKVSIHIHNDGTTEISATSSHITKLIDYCGMCNYQFPCPDRIS